MLVEFLKAHGVGSELLVSRAVRTVRNLANDSAATRRALRQAGATEQLVQLIAHGEESEVSVDAIAAIGYLAHHDQQTKATVRKMGGVPLLIRMLHAGSPLEDGDQPTLESAFRGVEAGDVLRRSCVA